MRKFLLAALCMSPFIAGLAVAVEPRAPTDAEIRAKQAIGRTLISPDNRFFVYEWMRPYNWVRDTAAIPKPAASRMQAWLYRVDIDRSPPNSEYVFFPESGASYWLGAFSPDGSKLSFYELDNDNNVLKTGVVAFTDPITPKLIWLEPAPDGNKLEQPPVWLANDELVYPTASGLVRAKLSAIDKVDYDNPIKAELCAGCAALVAQARAATEATEKTKIDQDKRQKAGQLPADSRLLAQSPAGDLTVFERNNQQTLGMLFRKGLDAPATVVFENERVLPSWSPPKWPECKEDAGKASADKPVADAVKPAEGKSTQ